MAFYICSNGVFHSHQFDFLKNENPRARLERTLIHGEIGQEKKREFVDEVFVHEMMTKNALCAEFDTPLASVKKIFEDKKIRHIPILRNSVELVGIISDRDMLKVSTLGTFEFLKAKDIMSTIIVVADEATPLHAIAEVMVKEKISAVPIINPEMKFCGIITKTDLLRSIFEFKLVKH